MRKPAFCICENKDTDQLRGKRTQQSLGLFCWYTAMSLLVFSSHFNNFIYIDGY